MLCINISVWVKKKPAHRSLAGGEGVVMIVWSLFWSWYWLHECIKIQRPTHRKAKISFILMIIHNDKETNLWLFVHPYLSISNSFPDVYTFTHQEPDILKCKVRWDLGSITSNLSSGGDGIPAELFQILKDDAVKVLNLVCQKIW